MNSGWATRRLDARRLYVSPPPELYTDLESAYHAGGSSYTEYNYLGSWPIRMVKTHHFEAALRATQPMFGRRTVIDMGCADGVFLPSLAAHFAQVIGIDRRPEFTDLARDVVEKLHLDNVTVLCNEGRSAAEVADVVRPAEASITFVLETLEHVGEPGRLYESKVEFVDNLFDLMAPGGLVVASVPVMIGPTFALMRGALRATGRFREPIARADFWRATLLWRTEAMEAGWQTDDHNGFNHRKLIASLRAAGMRVHDRSIGFSQLLLVSRP
jgi:predicted O-methyltransferase YrrM